MNQIKHYTLDTGTPLCGWHNAHKGEPYFVTDKLSLDICDLCLYVLWRKSCKKDILEGVPKCGAGITLWPEEESCYVSCEIPEILHEGIPEDEQIHWDFHIGYWIGTDPDAFITA